MRFRSQSFTTPRLHSDVVPVALENRSRSLSTVREVFTWTPLPTIERYLVAGTESIEATPITLLLSV